MGNCGGLIRCRLCRYIWGINDVLSVYPVYWEFIQEILDRCVYCGRLNGPPNHPGGVALIKGKNKRRGCEPTRKHIDVIAEQDKRVSRTGSILIFKMAFKVMIC